jgi:hypothetical protein
MSPAKDTERAGTSGASLTERVVVLFLLVAALVLGWIYFHVMPSRRPPTAVTFDLKNPLLDAALDECVQIESQSTPESLVCARVRAPGVVRRPRGGPHELGIYRDLKRSRPYLASGLRYPPPGKDCTAAGREEIELFDLNAFGMPYSLHVSLDAIRPMWVRYGGRYLFVYEVQFTQYGAAPCTWFVDVHPDWPVTGVVRRRQTTQHDVQTTLFTAAEDCR